MRKIWRLLRKLRKQWLHWISLTAGTCTAYWLLQPLLGVEPRWLVHFAFIGITLSVWGAAHAARLFGLLVWAALAIYENAKGPS